MGIKFKVPKRTALFEFEDGDWKGAEVRCALDVPMRTLFRFRVADQESAESLYRLFAEQVLISWNLIDDEGNDVPATPEKVLDQPNGFVDAIVQKWMEYLTTVPKDSKDKSIDGSTSPVPTTKTESELPSQ